MQVNTGVLRDAYMAMQTQQRLMSTQISSIDSTINELARETVMEEVRHNLQKYRNDIEEERQGLLSMILALETICNCYEECEDRVVEEEENTQVQNQAATFEFVEFDTSRFKNLYGEYNIKLG